MLLYDALFCTVIPFIAQVLVQFPLFQIYVMFYSFAKNNNDDVKKKKYKDYK